MTQDTQESGDEVKILGTQLANALTLATWAGVQGPEIS